VNHKSTLDIQTENQTGALTVLDVVVILAEHKRAIFIASLLCAAIAAAVSFILPNQYISRVTLLSPVVEQSSAQQMVMGQLGLPSELGREIGLSNPLDTYVAMLESDNLSDRLIDKFQLLSVYRVKTRSDARERLAKQTTVEITKNGTLTIAYEDHDPQFAAAVADAYVNALRDLMHDLSSSEAQQRLEFFNGQLLDARNELEKSETQLRDTQTRTGIIQLDLQAKAVVEEDARLRADAAAKRVEIASMRSYSTERNPAVAQAETELASLEGELDAAERKSQSPEGDLLITSSKMPAAGMDYVRALREVRYRQELVELLARQYENARLDAGKQAVFLRILDHAWAADRKSGPPRLLIVLIVVVVSAFAASCVYVIAELDRRFQQNPDRDLRMRRIRKHILGRWISQ
jgi:tyrosine-protein kinase Etk/Wzc